MKKLLALVVLMAFVFPAVAHAETVLWHDEIITILALWEEDGAVYLFTRGAFYKGIYYRLTDQGIAEEHPFSSQYDDDTIISVLIPGDDALWALLHDAEGNPSLAELSFDDAGNVSLGARIPFNWDDILPGGKPVFIFPMVHDGVFCFIDITGDDRAVVMTYNLETGKRRDFETDEDDYLVYAMGIFPYQEDTALVASMVDDPSNLLLFYLLNLETGEMTQAFSLPLIDPSSFGAPLYDAENDTLYFLLNGQFLRVKGLDPDSVEVICDAKEVRTYTDTYAVFLDSNTIAIADWYTAWAYRLDASEEEAAQLSIAADDNELLNAAYDAFLKKNPGMDIKINNDFLWPGEISKAILAQSTEYDVYQTYAGWQDYAALYEKGYLPSLSGSDTLTALSDELYPTVQDVILKDGELLAFPVGYDMFTPTYNPAAFAALGLTEEDVPTNWVELLRLLQRVPALIEGTEYTAFDPMNTVSELPDMLLSAIFDAYELYLENDPSADMRFDTEIMRTLLAEYEKIDFTRLGAYEARDTYADMSDEKNILFQLEGWISCESIGEMRLGYNIRYGADAPALFQPMTLSLAGGMEPMVKGAIYLAFLNPYSVNQETALRYLETAAEMMPETLCANLCPNWTEPIKREKADERIADLQARIQALETEVENATGDEKAQYQTMLDAAKAEFETEQELFYWLVSEDDLAIYRAQAEYMRVWRFFGLNTEGEGEFNAQMDQYLSGVIDGQTMLENIDDKIRMMLLEE